MKKNNTFIEPQWMLIAAFFASGLFLGGLALYLWLNVPVSGVSKIHPLHSKYKFINPLLAVEVYEKKEFSGNRALELALQGMMNDTRRGVYGASVYFRDIEPGLWLGINENQNFSPGKLLKIPIMISYFKLAESDPEILNTKLTFLGKDSNIGEVFPPKQNMKYGNSYTAEDLIKRMIVNNDNNAANLLFEHIDKKVLNEIYSDLGINFVEEKNYPDFISTKIYSLFFRLLYNATYLNRDFSEKALEILILEQESTGLGLVAGLPKSVPIADNLGVRFFKVNGNANYEMYDCGIVYYPEHNYLLCLVAKSANLDNLQKFFKDVGRLVYANFDYKYGKK